LDVSRMAELRLLMMIDRVGQAWQQAPQKVAQVRASDNQDRRRTIHDLCAEVGIGYGSCQRILTEQLNMHRNAAKFVPRVLTQDRKDSRVVMSGTEGNCDKRSHTPLECQHRR